MFEVCQLGFNLFQSLFRDEICFVEQQDVAIDHLGSADFAFQELVVKVFRVDQGNDRIQAGLISQFTTKKGHGNGERICQAGGFHNEVIDWVWTFENPINRFKQLPINRAADAAIAEFDHVIAGGHDQLVVDANFTEFIHQYGGFDSVLIAEDVVEQGGFAGA